MNSSFEPAQPDPADTPEIPGASASAPATRQSQLISTVLSPAVRFWVRSQLEQVEDLQVKIEAGDRQLLSGAIARISVSARNAVYQGLHLSQVQLVGSQIRTNLRQILRGKPLRLLEAFPVVGEIGLLESDLNASLQAPLLAQAVIDLLLLLLQSDAPEDLDRQALVLQNPQIRLGDGQLTLVANLVAASGALTPVAIRTGLGLHAGQYLKFDRPQWLPHAKARQGLPLDDLDGYTIDLGSQVALEKLTIVPGELRCQGQILVTPDQDGTDRPKQEG